jgi:hypothetical protein
MFLQKLYSLKLQTTFIAHLDNSTQLQEELNQKAQVSGLELRRGPEICALHLLPHHGISLTESQNVSRHATKNAGIFVFVLIILYSLYLEYDRPLIPSASGQAG